MSTIFYGFRIPKADLWPFIRAVRGYYRDESILGRHALQLWTKDGLGTTAFTHHVDKLEANRQELEVQVQLFDIGDEWVLRILENTYFFMNNREKMWPDLATVFYDDRSETLEEIDPTLRELVEIVNRMADDSEYFLCRVIGVDDIWNDYYIGKSKQ